MFDAALAYVVFFFLLVISIIYYKYLKAGFTPSGEDLQVDSIMAFLEANGGNHVSHLILLQDKEVYWAQQQKVLIIYKRVFNKLVVLGDPIGAESHLQAAIKEFYEYSESKGLKPIFYQISPRFMAFYHETGYRFLKLGEEGMVDLDTFTLEGKQGAKLRTRLNKFARNGYTFSVVYPPFSTELLAELKMISDSWLGGQKEKGFSVVSFSEEYVSCFPVAVLSDPSGKMIAFATLATDHNKTITIDLMRKSAESPHGTMDVLFIHIFHWAKENGYHTCSMGMAPLANVGTDKYARKTEKLLHQVYLHGHSLYNFKGLKEFKGKFAGRWEPKYLAYKKTFLPVLFIQLLVLINRQPHPQYVVEKRKYRYHQAG